MARLGWAAIAGAITIVTACSGDHGRPRLAAATGTRLASCAELAGSFRFAHTTIASAEPVPSGGLTWGDDPRGRRPCR